MSDQSLHADAVETTPIETASSGGEHVDDTAAEPLGSAFHEGADNSVQVDDLAENRGDTRPADVPEKFWDADAGTLRTETLLKSYLELERKLGTMVPMPNGDDPKSRHKLQRALGKPESADDYTIESPHELIAPDQKINARLHEAGLSSEQAQLVYDLAAEHLLPMIEEVNESASQEVERTQLATHFGGEQRWQAIAPQIKTWAEANLSDEIYDSLGSSADGVVAIYHMMQAREPNVISEAAVPTSQIDQRQLSHMMRDPRYWRDRDPTFVAEVTAGYKQLFD